MYNIFNMKNVHNILAKLSNSAFRSKFYLTQKDKEYVKEKGIQSARK